MRGWGGGVTPAPVAPAPTTPGTGTGSGGGGVGPAPVNLRSVIGAGTPTSPTYVILAQSGVTTTTGTAVTGDIGVSPIAASAVTGFGLVLDSTGNPPGCFSKSTPLTMVSGRIFAADYTAAGCTTSTLLTTAVADVVTAYNDAAGRTPDFNNIGTGAIGGMILPAGIYKWTTGVSIPSNVTLNGGANDTWIFQIAGGITQASGTRVLLTGGALPKNIFWQAAGVVDIGTTAHMEGVILAKTAITLKTGATANSRLLAQTAVTLQSNTVTQPAP